MSDSTVGRVLRGEKDAFRLIVREYGSTLRAFFAARLCDPDTVEDLVQETFVAAYEALDRYDEGSDFRSWLRGIAGNKLLMHLRLVYRRGTVVERLRTQALQEVSRDLDEAQDEGGGEALEKLRACLRKLPQRLREVVGARYFRNERVTAIARRLRTSANAISSLLFRVRKRLEACMRGAG